MTVSQSDCADTYLPLDVGESSSFHSCLNTICGKHPAQAVKSRPCFYFSLQKKRLIAALLLNNVTSGIVYRSPTQSSLLMQLFLIVLISHPPLPALLHSLGIDVRESRANK